MTRLPKSMSIMIWTALIVAAFVAASVNIACHQRQAELQGQIAQLRRDIVRIKAEVDRGDTSRLQAKGLCNASRHLDVKVAEMLARCRSAKDFLVADGPRIACATLSTSTPDTVIIGIYLPPGKHTFCYASADIGMLSDTARKHFLSAAASSLVKSRAIELDSGRYECVLKANGDEPARLSINTLSGEVMQQWTIPTVSGRCELTPVLPKDVFSFPSEVKVDVLPISRSVVLEPAVDIGRIAVQGTETGQHVDLRLWIESDAPACMSAIGVAANYEQVVRNALSGSEGLIASGNQGSGRFALFKPYEGKLIVEFDQSDIGGPERRP